MDVTTRPALDDEVPVKRRKLRKGTRSCLDCRRRKVKCIFTAPDSVKCIVCERRGAQCISQYDSAALDGAVEGSTLHHHTGHSSPSSELRAIPCQPSAPASLDEYRNLETSCTTSHLTSTRWSMGNHDARLPPNGSILTPQSGETPVSPATHSYRDSQPHTTVREALLRALPCEKDIRILSERLSALSAIQYESDYKYHGTWSDERSKSPTSFKDLLHPERHPTLLARQMLLFAAAVQHLSPKEVIPGLTEHHYTIMRMVADAAIQWVNMSDALLGTLEAVENLIFEMFYNVESSNLRRAWITTHRAVTAAQMLGLHRPGHHRFTRINDENDLDPDLMWTTIVSMERILSLLLGLPTSTSNMSLTSQKLSDSSGNNLSALVADLAGKIIKRNEADSSQTALDMTVSIDREIIMAAEQMPNEFWRPLAFSGLEKDCLQALMETRRAFGHMCYYSLVVQLHLPHMLNPQDASRRLHSKIACANASREVLTREIEMRTFNPIAACCRMSDFLALIAGMALMLGHITSHSGNESDHLLRHQRLGDRATVERMLDCITPMSESQGDMLAIRCSALLRNLLAIEQDAVSQFSLSTSNGEAGHSQGGQPIALTVRVPYLGSIQISRAGVAAIPAVSKDQDQQMADQGVTIGGIGSISVQESPTMNTEESDNIASNSLHQAVSTSATPHNSTEHRHAALDTAVMMSNPVFPDAAASFDDWVFQGVDTAFMETLLSGSGIPFSDDLGDESWDISTLP